MASLLVIPRRLAVLMTPRWTLEKHNSAHLPIELIQPDHVVLCLSDFVCDRANNFADAESCETAYQSHESCTCTARKTGIHCAANGAADRASVAQHRAKVVLPCRRLVIILWPAMRRR